MSILPAPRATSLRAAPAATLDPDSTHRAFSLAEDAVVFQRMGGAATARAGVDLRPLAARTTPHARSSGAGIVCELGFACVAARLPRRAPPRCREQALPATLYRRGGLD